MQSRIPHNRIINSTGIFNDSRDNDNFVQTDDNDDEWRLTYSEGVVPPITFA